MNELTNKTTKNLVNNINTKSASLALILGVVLIAANLRAPITSVGPLVSYIRDDLGISNTLAGMITTLPLLAFALFSPFAPNLANKYGTRLTIFSSIIFLTIGITIRSVAGSIGLFLGTAIIGLAISVCNVLLPSLVKLDFPDKIGTMTGIYTVSMNAFGAIASGVSVPIALSFGWSGSLGIWIILSFVAMAIWIPQLKRNQKSVNNEDKENIKVSLWKSPLAWQVSIYMGLQSLLFYSMVAWLPEILIDRGMASSQAGLMLSLLQIAIIPVTFIISIIAGRRSNQRFLVIIGTVCALIGILGLLSGNLNYAYICVILLGVGGGFKFGLSMMFFNLRTLSVDEAARLSGMAQSVGYLLAACGPMLFGYLHDISNGWTMPLIMLLAILAICFAAGLGASRDIYVNQGK